MEKTLYRITDAAPSHVCGQRVRAGDLLILHPQVAEYERDLGHLATTDAEAEAQPIDVSIAEGAELLPLDPAEVRVALFDPNPVEAEPDDAQD